MKLYKRNQAGKIIFWSIDKALTTNSYTIKYGLVDKEIPHCDDFIVLRNNIDKEINSKINQKRKEGYKELSELRDNAPYEGNLSKTELINYLNTYLPKYNLSKDNAILPMLCKTLEDNKPFTKGTYLGQYKINGERCLIGAVKTNDIFSDYKLIFQSREGVRWQLPYLEEYLKTVIRGEILDLMIEEGAYLDGELYLPGYKINNINSFIKNPTLPQHKLLQYWCYDIAIDNMVYDFRKDLLENNFINYQQIINSKEQHLNNKDKFVLLNNYNVVDYCSALSFRDTFVSYGFEGLVIRKIDVEYGFDKRNTNMMKFKPLYDGQFKILDIVPEGKRRSNLPKFICKNDINEGVFEVTIKGTFEEQEQYLINKEKYIGKMLFVEYRERSGVQDLPFHAKGLYVIKL